MLKKLKNNLFIGIGLALLLLFVQSSCTDYKDVEIVRVLGAYPSNITSDGLELDIAVRINNPNNYNITIVKSDLNLSLSNKKVGNTTLVKKVKLKKMSEEVYRFTVSGKFDKDSESPGLSDIFYMVTERAIPLKAEGSIKARALGIISKKIPVNFKERVEI